MSLPPFESNPSKYSSEFIEHALEVLLEPSPILKQKLVPNLIERIQFFQSSSPPYPTSYSDLIDLSISILGVWKPSERADFISGHPRIGEVSNLSALSAAEQASKKTQPEVLERLEYLNSQYEAAYPGLRYITFVNGRSRAEIVPEMESVLGLEDGKSGEVDVHEQESEKWMSELERAIGDIGLIAKARLAGMNLH